MVMLIRNFMVITNIMVRVVSGTICLFVLQIVV